MINFSPFPPEKSTYWAYKAKTIAKQNGEFCSCWIFKMPLVQFKSEDGNLSTIKAIVVCEQEYCNRFNFIQTETVLAAKFKDFYR